ncbi:phosphoenolpyruvate--protein phosphotransferase [Sphingomonas sp. MA1305]|uniref:phosphoenolpyruvate--protein phosphotransferase n=1 Tax=Sphingomonas sp. MA1305 TaxID=2479204 RepID=UPI0018DEF510|nr:phosphoenolpyruvate--protein phosphotransferase [Sphingomonas sp. MA1305]MBI0473836.1 phosphoenolpyruvate--protein phosphotransferase [Sphingomonas sp. MA1305]
MTDVMVRAPLDGWAMTLGSVPDPVFAGGMMGGGLAIDPTGDTLHAPCDARVAAIHAARHAVTLDAGNGVQILLHLGIDSVTLGGAPFTMLVAIGDRVGAGDPLVRFDLDALVRGAAAAATPVLVVEPDGATITDLAAEGPIRVGDPLYRVTAADTSGAAATATGETLRHEMRVGLPHGLHARPAARIAAAARDSGAEVTLLHGADRAAATSPVALLSLGLAHDAAVTIEARGAGAAAAIAAIVPLLTAEVEGDVTHRSSPAPVAPAPVDPDALVGVAAAPGLVIGTACWLRPAEPDLPPAATVAEEQARLDAALRSVGAALAAPAGGAQIAAVMAAHRAILDDPDLVADARRRIDTGASAAASILAAAEAQGARLRATGNARVAERADDIRDVALRVVYAALGTQPAALTLPEGAILLAEDLLPSQLAALDAARLAGIAVAGGGPTSHVAILAAGMGVPMAVALGRPLDGVADGASVILDGDAGTLLAEPDARRRAAAVATIDARAAAEATARAAGDRPATTRDGTPIAVYANLGSVDDARAAAAQGAEGCGLLRTEFLFLDRSAPPSIDEQAADYAGVVAALGGKPVVIRLLDVGGDKPAPYLDLPAEENPALGVRGIRVSLAQPALLDAQLRAILAVPDRAACRIMVPMVASVGELATVRAALDRLLAEIGGPPVQLGAMVETPAAAATADLIAAEADFLSIGSNDLTQYVLAMDRGNPALAAGIDGLHPAVLRLIATTCDLAARSGTPVSVCGGLAADPLAAPILVGLGVRTLSVPPARVPATKALVATLDGAAAAAHARAALAADGPAAVRALARAFSQESR